MEAAREYLRVSRDRSGRLQSPAEQHAENAAAAAGNGWALGEPYAEDTAVSASRYSGRARAAFDRLGADLESGAFGAGVLILWESSRGSRKVLEWAALIDACEEAGVRIHVTSHGRTYDPANGRDRRSLHEDATDSEYESWKLSARIRRTSAALAAEGRPNGRVPYGFLREYDPVTRRVAAQGPHPDEAPVIAALYARLLDGHSLRQVARDFAAAGIANRKGTPFAAEHLRAMALWPCYAGLRTHRPRGTPAPGPQDAVDAIWPALVSRQDWDRVHAMLTDPSRRTSRPGRGVHLLSMIARCGVCGGVLSASWDRGGRRAYICHGKACVRAAADGLDELAGDVICRWAARDDVAALTAARGHDSAALRAVRLELDAAAAELADWRSRAGAGNVSPGSFAAIEPGVLARIAGLQRRERDLTAPTGVEWLAGAGPAARRAWEDAAMPQRRRAARALLSPAYLGVLSLLRAPRRGAAAEDRVTFGPVSAGANPFFAH